MYVKGTKVVVSNNTVGAQGNSINVKADELIVVDNVLGFKQKQIKKPA